MTTRARQGRPTPRPLEAIIGIVAKGGKGLGRAIAEAYRSVDPDVGRHVAQWPLLAPTLLLSNRERVEPGEADGHPPVVFVHGLGGSRGNFLPMAVYLRLKGRKRSYRVYLNPDHSVDRRAKTLAMFVDRVIHATGERQVDMIAHSLGGIIARLAIHSHHLEEKVSRLITLGAPHQGTYPARYVNTKGTRDLRPDSPFIVRMKGIPWPKGVHGTCFWSRNDLFVLPPESAILKGAEAVDLSPFTHYSYLVDPKGWAAVHRALDGGQ